MPSFKKINEGMPDSKHDKWVGFRDISFIHDSKDPMKLEKPEDQLQLCVVGTDGKTQRLKVINQQNRVVKHQNYIHDQGEINRCMFVKTPLPCQSKQLSGFVSGSDSGQIQLLLHPFLEGGISKFIVHQGAVTALTATPDFKMLFSASSDGSVFLFQISEERINPDISLTTEEVQSEPPKIMD